VDPTLQLVHALSAEGIVVNSSMRLHRHPSISVIRIVVVSVALFESVPLILSERLRLLPAWPTFLVTKAEPAFAPPCETDRVLSICVGWLMFPLVALEKDEDRDGTHYTEQPEAYNKSKEP
jgi:hypothetical protein